MADIHIYIEKASLLEYFFNLRKYALFSCKRLHMMLLYKCKEGIKSFLKKVLEIKVIIVFGITKFEKCL